MANLMGKKKAFNWNWFIVSEVYSIVIMAENLVTDRQTDRQTDMVLEKYLRVLRKLDVVPGFDNQPFKCMNLWGHSYSNHRRSHTGLELTK